MNGIVAHLREEHDVAVRQFRDAVVLQRGGKGVFHAEAVAWLVVALCDAGAPADAAAAMERFPARHLAVIPGIEDWARGVLACTRGDPETGAQRLVARGPGRAQRRRGTDRSSVLGGTRGTPAGCGAARRLAALGIHA